MMRDIFQCLRLPDDQAARSCAEAGEQFIRDLPRKGDKYVILSDLGCRVLFVKPLEVAVICSGYELRVSRAGRVSVKLRRESCS